MNPFKYNTIVSGKDFCDRNDLLKTIIELLNSSKHIILCGERNIGKSSTAVEAVRNYKGAKHIYVNLMGIESIDSLSNRILRQIVLLEQRSSWYKKLEETIGYKYRVQFNEAVSFDFREKIQADLLPKVMSAISSLYKKNRFVVILDEFQNILNLPDAHQALAFLSTAFRSQRHIPFIFVGSMSHKMDDIFSDMTSPFYHFAPRVDIDPIPLFEFSKFLKNRFSKGNRKIDNTLLRKLFEMSNDNPGYIQQFCESLWEVTSDNNIISLNKLESALELILAREQTVYKNYFNSLTSIQRKCLIALAKKGGSCATSAAILKSAGLKNTSDRRKAISRMLDSNILIKTMDGYRFANPFFRFWFIKIEGY